VFERRRAKLANVLTGLGVPQLLLSARRLGLTPARLTVLNYHRINTPEAIAELDTEVLDATPEAFDHQLGMLRRHFCPVSLDDLLAHLDGRPLPANPLLLTFDDGYLDNLELAVPALRRHGIAATFFIATGYVGGRRLFWWDRLSWTVKHARRRRFSVLGGQPVQIDLDAGLPLAERQLQRVIKRTPELDLERFLGSLADAADAPWSAEVEARLVDRHVMSWGHVRELRRAGMHVGSHTRTHRVLQTVPLAELAGELSGSRADLEAALGEPVQAIAYPVGLPVAGNPSIRAELVAAGYRLGFSYRTGLQRLRSLDPLDINRVGIDGGLSDAMVLSRSVLPRLFPS
jgi:peptidoglycan/xylan/chitin deacetylase (PgdA/CDA1 family)